MAASPNVLLVEVDRLVAMTLVQALSTDFVLEVVNTGKTALYKADATNYSLIVLDLNLTDISGMDVCQQLRQRGSLAPILILSGESQVMIKIRLLDAGANDYLTKPFRLGELRARMRALIRSHPIPSRVNTYIEAHGVILDSRNFSVSRDGLNVNLRRKEFELLKCLMESPGAVVTRRELLDRLWKNYEEEWTNTLDVHIKHLRDKIDRPFNLPLIQTVHGRGYKFEDVASNTVS